MKVKTRLYLSAIISISLVGVLVFGVVFTSNRIAEETREHEFLHDIQMATSELNIVLYEYLMHRETRMEQQWNSKYDSIMEVLRESEEELEKREKREEEEIELLKSIEVNFITIGDLFTQVSVNYKETQNLIQEGTSQEKIDTAMLLEERLVAQLLIISQSIFTNTCRLVEKAFTDTAEAQELARNLTLILVLIIVVISATTTLFVVRSISKPLDKLIKGTEIIGKGNLKHRINIKSKDEIGNLAVSFNDMSGKLTKSYSSLEQKVKERTAELEIAKNRSETLLASIGDAVFAINRESNIIHFNRRAEELSGYKASEVLGKPYYDFLKFIKEKDRSENTGFIRTALKGEATDMIDETILIRKDKRELPVADMSAPIKDKQGKILGAIVIFRNATQEREIEKMRAELISLTGHQLKTPLTAIRGYLEMLKESKLSTQANKYIGEIERGVKAMIELVSDVLNISRIEQGRVEIKPELTQLEEIVDSLVKDLLPLAKKRKVSIEFSKPSQPLLEVNVDPKYLREAIQNIISNAINYTKDKIIISLEKIDNELRFACTDNGIGIPKQEQSKIFTKFFRASNIAQTEIEGTGLGLNITKAIIEKSRGRIWFESEEGKGTTFYFTIPIIG